jgi:predicted transposase YbfD/YdcC
MSPTALSTHFGRLVDTRRAPRHELLDIIIIAICAVLCGADDWHQIAAFGRHRQDWLRRFLRLPNGIPAHDTFERVFARLNPRSFQGRFREWVRAIGAVSGIKQIAIDGKTLRGSRSTVRGLGALHLVSAWATEAQLSLGQVAVDAKSNEITAIPKLLGLLELHGALVTIDAMGCQKEIARTIVDRGGHYALTVKDNQEHLLDDIQASFAKAFDTDFADVKHDIYETRSKGHGREEYRCYTVLHSTEGIRNVADWANLTVIGMCYSERTTKGQTTSEVRYFIGDAKENARYYGDGLRHHWGIENQLHWQLDVTFGEDRNRVLRRSAAENLALVRKLALMLLKRHPAKESMAGKRFHAGLDVGFLEEIMELAEKM